MSTYRRAKIDGGIFFFTVVLADRRSRLLVDQIDRFRASYRSVHRMRPFQTIAICILPDHLHAIWALPQSDSDFSSRWSQIKSGFSRELPASVSMSSSQVAKRERGIWQRRFWEHTIRDQLDLTRHIDYIHINPVKHGHVTCVRDWPHSSFHRFVEQDMLPQDWGGDVKDIKGDFGE
jgi:putative transposase